MSEIEKLINPPKTTGVRWDLPESTMQIIKGYQRQLWKATGEYPTLAQVVTHMIEYTGKEANDAYFYGIVERKRQEREAAKAAKQAEMQRKRQEREAAKAAKQA